METSTAAPTFGLWYDYRNPTQWKTPAGELYRRSIDQAVWAEQLGFGSVWLSEHHFADDDYASSPLMMAAVLAARTSRMQIGTNIIVAGLHNPVRLAEDATALSLLSDNRFELGVGLGYRELEFSGFDRTVKYRPSLLEDAIAIVRQAWTGGSEGYKGKRLSLPALPVTPVPEVAPRLLVGAQSPAGIDRAARAGDGVITLSNEHCQVYLDALERHGKDVSEGRIYASQWTIIAEDPERVWAKVSENVLYQMNKYIEWGSFEGPDQPAQYPNSQAVLDSGAYRLMDASMAVDELVGLATEYPQIRDFHYWAQFPGESIESGSERIQYMADNVIPAVTERISRQAQPVEVG
ncbi:LLM class flavin-dependent oxidoreductase [Mycolicibacterium sp. P9-64]|uniref:LLM class flavin-dependent oxidoreductase n=1 Tax=Mycolicibacterium sp. P9-64 TaxID=2024612 RepID=UPI0011EFE462|nr:LLM class flavin-dependent oxidoreductase [Mycolicibacterium sp. P9-64]KAA0086663.1 LLM class flavin-dependent oxidoreductase [Mycolicibacterium sp. P9-64]